MGGELMHRPPNGLNRTLAQPEVPLESMIAPEHASQSTHAPRTGESVAPDATLLKLPVTVIIATRNEEKNLPRCLRSLERMDQVFVVDSHSTDRTADVAREHG